MAQIYHHTFENGLTLLAEPMDYVRSAAMNFLIPAGCAYDPPKARGIASALSALITRGAGERSNRELTLALDFLGLDRSESVGRMHMQFWGATVATNLPEALELYADILRRPHLPADELDAVKALALQDLLSLQDEPRQMVMLELRKHLYPSPLGQDRRGTVEGIEGLTSVSIRKHYQKLFRPNGTILSVAGNIDWPSLLEHVGRLFGDWKRGPETPLKLGKPPRRASHIAKDTNQTQIAVAYPSVPFGHTEYYAALGAVNVLSGGMSARLFTEVREKRGLCYSVFATYETLKDRGSILCYAGSKSDQAQETLDVLLGELKRLSKGVEEDELERVRAGLKSSLIMAEESTSRRAGTLASDWYYLGRVRPFEEVKAGIDSLTPKRIVDHVRRHPAKEFVVVTLGPQPLEAAV